MQQKKELSPAIINEANTIFETAKRLLLRQKYFYYNLIRQFRVKVSLEVPTMGVAWVDDNFYLIYNPEFVNRFAPKELMAIIEHECCHFVYNHMTQFRDTRTKSVFEDRKEAADYVKDQMKQQVEHRLRNIAMDRSINVYIPNLPNARMLRAEMGLGEKDKNGKIASPKILGIYKKGETAETDIVEVPCITEQSFKDLLQRSGYKGDIEAVNKYDTWQYYYDLLKQSPQIQKELDSIAEMDIHFQSGKTRGGGKGDQQGNGVRIKGEGENGDEEGNGEGGQRFEEGETPDGEVEKAIVEAAKPCNDNIPGHLRAMVQQALEKVASKPVPWYALLRRQIKTSIRSITQMDVNVRNRYYGGKRTIVPGYKDIPQLDIAVVYDVSGSCASPQIQGIFWNEIEALQKAGCSITIYYTDTEVEKKQEIGTKRVKPSDYQGVGGGGTHLDVGIKAAIDDGKHIIIMLSDCWMDFRLTKKDLKGRRVICACNTEDKMPAHYGPTIRINEGEY
jgi:predicted metal-dependent peptidase